MDGKAAFSLGIVFTQADQGDHQERVHLLTGELMLLLQGTIRRVTTDSRGVRRMFEGGG